MKKFSIFLIIPGGRTGTDFFLSLTDNHDQILQFPGGFYFDEFWEKAIMKKSSEIGTLFIKEYGYYFNSKLNKIDRLDKLGKKKIIIFLLVKINF